MCVIHVALFQELDGLWVLWIPSRVSHANGNGTDTTTVQTLLVAFGHRLRDERTRLDLLCSEGPIRIRHAADPTP